MITKKLSEADRKELIAKYGQEVVDDIYGKIQVEKTGGRESSGLASILARNDCVVTLTNVSKKTGKEVTKKLLNKDKAITFNSELTVAANSVSAMLSSQNLSYSAKVGKGAESKFNPNFPAFVAEYRKVVNERVEKFIDVYNSEIEFKLALLSEQAVNAKSKTAATKLSNEYDSLSRELLA